MSNYRITVSPKNLEIETDSEVGRELHSNKPPTMTGAITKTRYGRFGFPVSLESKRNLSKLAGNGIANVRGHQRPTSSDHLRYPSDSRAYASACSNRLCEWLQLTRGQRDADFLMFVGHFLTHSGRRILRIVPTNLCWRALANISSTVPIGSLPSKCMK